MIEGLNDLAAMWWNWMGPMSVQVTILIALVAVADLVLRNRAWPQVQLAIWSLVLLKLLFPPDLASPLSMTAGLTENRFLASRETVVAPDPGLPEMVTSQFRVPTSSSPSASWSIASRKSALEGESLAPALPGPSWKAALMLLWLAGVCLLGTGLLLRLRRFGQVLSEGARDAPIRVLEIFASASSVAGLSRLPRLLLTDRLPVPAAFGVLRPVVLLPCRLIEELSEEDLHNVLLHEATHIRRKDLFTQRVVVVLLILYWFHPLLWLLRRRLQQLQELCCDAAVATALRVETPICRSPWYIPHLGG